MLDVQARRVGRLDPRAPLIPVLAGKAGCETVLVQVGIGAGRPAGRVVGYAADMDAAISVNRPVCSIQSSSRNNCHHRNGQNQTEVWAYKWAEGDAFMATSIYRAGEGADKFVSERAPVSADPSAGWGPSPAGSGEVMGCYNWIVFGHQRSQHPAWQVPRDGYQPALVSADFGG